MVILILEKEFLFKVNWLAFRQEMDNHFGGFILLKIIMLQERVELSPQW
jgi:hypothetical protein